MKAGNRMHEGRHIDLERAKISPAKEFDHPNAVLRSSISKADKKVILDQWELDAKALARASDEGMAEGEAALLRDAQEALRKLARTTD